MKNDDLKRARRIKMAAGAFSCAVVLVAASPAQAFQDNRTVATAAPPTASQPRPTKIEPVVNVAPKVSTYQASAVSGDTGTAVWAGGYPGPFGQMDLASALIAQVAPVVSGVLEIDGEPSLLSRTTHVSHGQSRLQVLDTTAKTANVAVVVTGNRVRITDTTPETVSAPASAPAKAEAAQPAPKAAPSKSDVAKPAEHALAPAKTDVVAVAAPKAATAAPAPTKSAPAAAKAAPKAAPKAAIAAGGQTKVEYLRITKDGVVPQAHGEEAHKASSSTPKASASQPATPAKPAAAAPAPVSTPAVAKVAKDQAKPVASKAADAKPAPAAITHAVPHKQAVEQHPSTKSAKPTAGALVSSEMLPVDTTPVIVKREWHLREGAMLSQEIAEWARTWGWSMVWRANVDYRIVAPITLNADFLSGVGEMLRAYEKSDRPLWGNYNEQQKVLIVQEPEK